jgi:hypothetical protein
MKRYANMRAVGVFALGMLLFSVAARPQEQKDDGGKHRITFSFDYDFQASPPCSDKVKKKCVKLFVLYDLSAGIAKRTKLGTVAVPDHAAGLMKGISAMTDPILFNPGRHLIGVVAQMADGTESDYRKCTTIVTIPQPSQAPQAKQSAN